MTTLTPFRYQKRRGELEEYFDRTAVEAWAKLTSDAPVSGIRATVRAGRDQMRATLLSRLPEDLSGRRVLDAGCGTGALSVELAKRGAHVIAIDLSPNLIELAKERYESNLKGSIEFYAGDMLDTSHGFFEYVVCMDSVIHYHCADTVDVIAKLAQNTQEKIIFTFAPSNLMLELMIRVGKVFPRKDRSPTIVPIAEETIIKVIEANDQLVGWKVGFTQKISSSFYKSQAMEIYRK
jgi:magnesium-protoporphyrin O-methyltransferase